MGPTLPPLAGYRDPRFFFNKFLVEKTVFLRRKLKFYKIFNFLKFREIFFSKSVEICTLKLTFLPKKNFLISTRGRPEIFTIFTFFEKSKNFDENFDQKNRRKIDQNFGWSQAGPRRAQAGPGAKSKNWKKLDFPP